MLVSSVEGCRSGLKVRYPSLAGGGVVSSKLAEG